MSNFSISVAAIFTTLMIYLITRFFYQKYPNPFTLPILTSTLLIILGLLFFDISYDNYLIGAKWIDRFLGPAVVALAYPLYQQRDILRQNIVNILVSVTIGGIIGVSSGLIMGKFLGFDKLIILSLLPKSVTTPVAMDIAHSIGGIPSLAAVMVMVAGMSGAVLGPSLLKWVGVSHSIAKGLGMGSASHAIGTSKAMEINPKEGALSTIAMVLSAIIVSIITPLLVLILM